MVKETHAINAQHAYPFKRICWTAVFVGALIASGLSFLFNLFGVAIGLSAFTLDNEGAMVIALGGAIGLVIAVVVSMGLAGYAAGYLGRHYAPQKNLGILYGFVTWTVALLLSASFLGSMSNYTVIYAQHIGHSNFQLDQQSTKIEKKSMEDTKKKEQETKENQPMISMTQTNMVTGAFMIFVLFMLGAISTCVGASFGMACRRID